MNLREVNITNIVSGVIIADLASGPVKAFDLDNLAVLDSPAEGNSDTLATIALQVIRRVAIGIVPSGCHLFWFQLGLLMWGSSSWTYMKAFLLRRRRLEIDLGCVTNLVQTHIYGLNW